MIALLSFWALQVLTLRVLLFTQHRKAMSFTAGQHHSMNIPLQLVALGMRSESVPWPCLKTPGLMLLDMGGVLFCKKPEQDTATVTGISHHVKAKREALEIYVRQDPRDETRRILSCNQDPGARGRLQPQAFDGHPKQMLCGTRLPLVWRVHNQQTPLPCK